MAKTTDSPKPSVALSKKANLAKFALWIVGDTPLITHAWSEKARREMLAKQVKAVQVAKSARDPAEDFQNSLYELESGVYGFPAMAFKSAITSGAHKDKGITKTAVQGALWIDAEMVRTRPALAGAICDMPLLRIWSGAPEMREDMVRVGQGLQKKSSLAYRAQFTTWAIHLTGRVNLDLVPSETLVFLINEGGFSAGVGEWRNEKKGMFGAFHCADAAETKAWESFAAGKGKLPRISFKEAA
jgi:hypothetical protein